MQFLFIQRHRTTVKRMWINLNVLVFSCCIAAVCVNGTAISHVDSIFEIFSARSLIRFFEFNSSGWNLTNACARQVFQYLEALQKDQLWAMKMLDASGYYAGGMYEANELRLADPERCFRLNEEVNKDFWMLNSGDFLANTSFVPYALQAVVARYNLQISFSAYARQQVFQSICLPKMCGDHDLAQILSYNFIPAAKFNRFIKDVKLVSYRVLKSRSDFVGQDEFLIGLGAMTFIIIMLLTCASLCSIRNRRSIDLTEEDQHPNISAQGRINPQVLRQMSIQRAAMESNADEKTRNSLGIEMANNNDKLDAGADDDDDEVDEENSYTNVKMRPDDQQMTISNFNANNHVNLVKVKKIDTDNMISLDIISANCYNAFILRRKTQKDLQKKSYSSKFKRICSVLSWQHQFSTFDYDVFDLDTKKTAENDCINGLSCISTVWVIFIHTCNVLYYAAGNKAFKSQTNTNWLTGFILNNGSFAMDMYFFLSGISLFKVFYSTMKETRPDKIFCILYQLKYLLLLIVYKVFKMFLPYFVALLILRNGSEYFHSTSTLELPTNDHLTCGESIWRNLLYFDIFFPLQDRCMIWSWYLSVEIYFYIIAALLLMLSRTHPHFAVIIFTSFFISSFFTTAIIDGSSSSLASNLNSTSMHIEVLAEINILYDQPWIRISPYVIGIIFGFFLCKNDTKVKVDMYTAVAGWMFSISLLFLVLFGPLYLSGEVDLRILSFFSSFSHGIWALVLTWIIFSTVSGRGGPIGHFLSMRIFYPLSKLSNCVMLFHPLVTRSLILQGNMTINMSFAILIVLFIGFTVISYSVGFIVFILYESPVLSLLKLILEPTYRK